MRYQRTGLGQNPTHEFVVSSVDFQRNLPYPSAGSKTNDCGLVVRFLCDSEIECRPVLFNHFPCRRLVSVVEIVRSFISTGTDRMSYKALTLLVL